MTTLLLAANPATATKSRMVWGERVWGSVLIDGQEHVLIWDLSKADANRVGEVPSAILAAIPDRFDRYMHPD